MRFGRISNCWTSEAVHGLAFCSLMNLIPIKVTKITFLEIDITPWALKDGSASLIYVVVFDSNERADCAVRLWNSATNFLTPPLFDVAVFALPAVFIFATTCKFKMILLKETLTEYVVEDMERNISTKAVGNWGYLLDFHSLGL